MNMGSLSPYFLKTKTKERCHERFMGMKIEISHLTFMSDMEKPESDGIAIISGSTSADGQQDPAVQKRQLENFIKVLFMCLACFHIPLEYCNYSIS